MSQVDEDAADVRSAISARIPGRTSHERKVERRDSAETAIFDFDSLHGLVQQDNIQPQSDASMTLPIAGFEPEGSQPAPGQIAEPSDVAIDESSAPGWPERDRIVILGRRQSGKTTYLATIYERLWRTLGDVSAKTTTGQAHQELMTVARQLQDGQWPASTLGTTPIGMDIDYHGTRRRLVVLDYAGELFGKAFLDEQHDLPGVKELVEHIDHAAAVLLMVDPAVVVGMNQRAIAEDDFGMVQAVYRIRNQPGGEEVPIVLILTKVDVHQKLLDRLGGSVKFVRHSFPALVRTIKRVPIFQVSAVQAEPAHNGRTRPARHSTPINVENPLLYCLQKIEKAELKQKSAEQDLVRQAEEAQQEKIELARERRLQWLGYSIIGAMLAIGAVVICLIVHYQV